MTLLLYLWSAWRTLEGLWDFGRSAGLHQSCRTLEGLGDIRRPAGPHQVYMTLFYIFGVPG